MEAFCYNYRMSKDNTKSNRKLALALLIISGLLTVGSVITLIVINLIFNPTFWMTPDTSPITPTPVYITVLNGVFITSGVIGMLSFVPALAVGIYLLTNKRRSKAKKITS